MDGRATRTDFDEAGDYVVPNVFSPRDLVFRSDKMDETVPHTLLGFSGIRTFCNPLTSHIRHVTLQILNVSGCH